MRLRGHLGHLRRRQLIAEVNMRVVCVDDLLDCFRFKSQQAPWGSLREPNPDHGFPVFVLRGTVDGLTPALVMCAHNLKKV